MCLALWSTVKGSPIKKSRNTGIGPFTSTDDLTWRTVQMKDNDRKGFMIITFKKRQSFKPANDLFQTRLKWSSELVRVPTLDHLSKGRSQAQVGGALGYTDTTHWYSGSAENPHSMPVGAFTEEENSHFSLSRSVGEVVSQQLLHGNVVCIGTNGSYRSGGSSHRKKSVAVAQGDSAELVPLSITDELEKKSAKILTPRSCSAYLSLPIVSETYPVMLHADHQHKPFSSPGFHSVGPGKTVPTARRGGRTGAFHSAIVRITQSQWEQHLGRGVGGGQWMERYTYPQALPETTQNTKRLRAHKITLQRLTAYDDVVNAANMPKLPKQCHSPSPLTARSVPAFRRPLLPVVAPRQKSIIAADVGCVLNGVNPKHHPDISACSPYCFQGLLGTARMKTNSYRHQTPSLPHKSPDTHLENKMGFLFISKPLNHNPKDLNPFVCKDICIKEENHTGQTPQPVRQEAGVESVSMYGVSFHLSKAKISTESKDLKEMPAMRGTAVQVSQPSPAQACDRDVHSEASNTSVSAKHCLYLSEAQGEDRDSEGVLKTVFPFDQQQAISIPTANTM